MVPGTTMVPGNTMVPGRGTTGVPGRGTTMVPGTTTRTDTNGERGEETTTSNLQKKEAKAEAMAEATANKAMWLLPQRRNLASWSF